MVVRSVLYVTLSGLVEKVDAESENRDPATDGCRIRWYPIGSGNDLIDIENGSSEPEPELSFDEPNIFLRQKFESLFQKNDTKSSKVKFSFNYFFIFSLFLLMLPRFNRDRLESIKVWFFANVPNEESTTTSTSTPTPTPMQWLELSQTGLSLYLE